MAFRRRSQRKTKKLPQSQTIEFSPDASIFNLQIFESSLDVLTEKKGKWKKTYVVLQSGRGVFTTLLLYKKSSRFVAKLAPLEKFDLHLGYSVSLGEIIKNKYIINIHIRASGGQVQLAADSEELRSMWIHELITKKIVDPISSDCLQWFVVRIKETVGTNRLKLSGKCTLCIYKDRVVLATTDGTMLGDFPLEVIKSYKCSEEFHLNLSSNSMYGDLTLFIVTDQTYELFERIHRLKMESMGRDVELPSLTTSIIHTRKISPDDSVIVAPSRRLSKRDQRGKLQDSASETDILAAVRACNKPPKPPISRQRLMLPQIPAGRSLSNAADSMKPRIPITRLHSPNLYGRHNSEFLDLSPEYPTFGTQARRPSEPKMLHSTRKDMAQFPAPGEIPPRASVKTHAQFTSPDLYDHVMFKPQLIKPISEASLSQSLTGPTQYDSLKSVNQSRKKVNIYETLSFGESEKYHAYLKAIRDPNEVPDIPVTCPNPPKRGTSETQKEGTPKISLTNSLTAQNNPSDPLDNSISSQNSSVFSVSPPPPPPLPPHKEDPSSPLKEKEDKKSQLDQLQDSPKKRGTVNEVNKHNSSLKSLDSYKRASKNNHYEFIHNGLNSLSSGRRKARRIKLGKARSEMPPDMLASENNSDKVGKNGKGGTRASSFTITPEKNWEVA